MIKKFNQTMSTNLEETSIKKFAFLAKSRITNTLSKNQPKSVNRTSWDTNSFYLTRILEIIYYCLVRILALTMRINPIFFTFALIWSQPGSGQAVFYPICIRIRSILRRSLKWKVWKSNFGSFRSNLSLETKQKSH